MRCGASAEVSLLRMPFLTCRNVTVGNNPEAYALSAVDCLCPSAGCEQGGGPEEVP